MDRVNSPNDPKLQFAGIPGYRICIKTGGVVSRTSDNAYSDHSMILESFYLRKKLYGQIGLVRFG